MQVCYNANSECSERNSQLRLTMPRNLRGFVFFVTTLLSLSYNKYGLGYWHSLNDVVTELAYPRPLKIESYANKNKINWL